ncbi:MAG TPA: hypothetical protein VMA09_09980 [Candidatus Binataceae bacterium]|nr:hypothetical protein [Candidatus Binataceae bacterium]
MRAGFIFGILIAICSALCIAGPASAQQATPAAEPTISDQELAKSVHNPFEDFVKIPIQATTGFRVGPEHNAGEAVNVQPLFPFHLNSMVDMFVQPSQTITYIPSPHEQFGLNDFQTSFFFSPAKAHEWIWGAGPILLYPTATGKELGSGRWSAGPTGAVVYDHGPWFEGVLAYHLMSYAGDRSRGSVNYTYIEPDFSYNWDSGWYVQTDPPMSYDWTAAQNEAWVIPVGGDVGDAFTIDKQSLSLQAGSYYFVKRPDDGPQWMIRFQFTLLFPTAK